MILAYHWYTGSASQVFDCNTESIKCYTTQSPFFGQWNLANNSTIFVAPDGIDAGWANTNGRDLALTDDILKEVEADLCIDTSRVFANGFSYGGSMTAMLACQRADVFRAVAVYAGGISGMSGACTGTTPIAYYGATGTQDSGYSRGTERGPALRPGEWLHRASAADAAHGRPHLRVLPGLLGGPPAALVSLRRHPHPVAARPQPIDDLATPGGLDVLYAILSARLSLTTTVSSRQ